MRQITIVIPVFNEEESISKTLLNLKNISGIDEIIVVDDGSTDNSYYIMKNISGIKFIHHKENSGYGASTKGNIVLNFCNIGPEDLPTISDRNPEKFGLVTPGTGIPIISHEQMREEKPDYLFVLIWHFRKEVIEFELEFLAQGGKLVFNLPRLHTVDKNNYNRYLNTTFDELAYPL